MTDDRSTPEAPRPVPAPAPPVSRRAFLTGLGAAGAVLVAGGYAMSVWARGGAGPGGAGLVAGDLGPGAEGRTLVVVELGGGNDGLNTLVPHADPRYRALRPTLGVGEPIDLDGEVGLHPSLGRLAARWRAGQVAAVEGVGVTDGADLSHFASLAAWWAGGATGGDGTGWLGRYLDGTVGTDHPLAAVSIGPRPSPALAGERSFVAAIADERGLAPRLPASVPVDALVDAWGSTASPDADPATLAGRLERVIARTVQARSELAAVLDASGPTVPEAPAADADGGITRSLALAARLVTSAAPPRVVYVNGTGDFDTHQGQATRHPALLADLDAGVDGFFAALEAVGAAGRALVVTVSEFGRRPQENGSGTDHGTASVLLAVGPAVRGGRHGTPPDLGAPDRAGNVTATTDFRSVYAAVLGDWLAVDASAVLGAPYPPVPFLA